MDIIKNHELTAIFLKYSTFLNLLSILIFYFLSHASLLLLRVLLLRYFPTEYNKLELLQISKILFMGFNYQCYIQISICQNPSTLVLLIILKKLIRIVAKMI